MQRKINICGIPYKIIETKDAFNVDCHLGQIEYTLGEIRINSDMTDAMKKNTLCHEILHGILVHIGRDDLSQDEQFVTALGTAINQSFIPICEMEE